MIVQPVVEPMEHYTALVFTRSKTLWRQVGQGHLCLWCGERGKRFSSREDVQRHMVDKGHCKMRHEAECLLEYDEWYDYSASYPEGTNSTQATVGGVTVLLCLQETRLERMERTGRWTSTRWTTAASSCSCPAAPGWATAPCSGEYVVIVMPSF